MYLPIDEWHDWLRLGTFFVCTVSIGLLLHYYRISHHHWNRKTRDYWYSLFMWSCAGCVIAIEGIYLNSRFGLRAIFVIAASSITLKGLLTKGSWGNSED